MFGRSLKLIGLLLILSVFAFGVVFSPTAQPQGGNNIVVPDRFVIILPQGFLDPGGGGGWDCVWEAGVLFCVNPFTGQIIICDNTGCREL